MCGIFFLGSPNVIHGKERKKFMKRFKNINHRGPDDSLVQCHGVNAIFGFHRLQIVDPTPTGMQPFISSDNRFVCIVNGEIYNYNELTKTLKSCKKCHYNPVSDSDCEVVLHLFIHYLHPKENKVVVDTIDEAASNLFQCLDGEYAIIIYDNESKNVLFGVDQLRIRPMFYARDKNNNLYLCSEQKALKKLPHINPIPAGTYSIHNLAKDEGKNKIEFKHHFDFDKERERTSFLKIDYKTSAHQLRKLLTENLKKKLFADREYAFLLSGGLDSSLICSLASKILAPKRIRTFTFGFSRHASDVIAAEKVAKHLDSIHETYIFNFEKGANLVEEVIYYNESWDQTTTRASTAMLLGLKKMCKNHPGIAVLFSGELSDELLRGYLYNLNSPDPIIGRKEAIDRLENVTYFDGLRADRMTSRVSCELRLPFFSKSILNFVLSLPPEYIDPSLNNNIEKKLLRDAFDKDENGNDLNMLPDNLLWRTKHAMSDGTSEKDGWKSFLGKFANKQVTDSRFKQRNIIYKHCPPDTKEDMWYREIFDLHGYSDTAVPFKWMPSWCDKSLMDSSATALSVFHED